MTTTTPVVTSVLLQALLEHEVTVITVVVWAVVVVKWAVGVVSVSVSGADDSGTLDSGADDSGTLDAGADDSGVVSGAEDSGVVEGTDEVVTVVVSGADDSGVVSGTDEVVTVVVSGTLDSGEVTGEDEVVTVVVDGADDSGEVDGADEVLTVVVDGDGVSHWQSQQNCCKVSHPPVTFLSKPKSKPKVLLLWVTPSLLNSSNSSNSLLAGKALTWALNNAEASKVPIALETALTL